ncbi:hypothetical protein [Streptomyces sp. MH13]
MRTAGPDDAPNDRYRVASSVLPHVTTGGFPHAEPPPGLTGGGSAG